MPVFNPPACSGKLFPVINGRTHVKPCGWEGQFCPSCEVRKREAMKAEELSVACQKRIEFRAHEPERRAKYLTVDATAQERFDFLYNTGWRRGTDQKVKGRDGKEYTRKLWWMPNPLIHHFYGELEQPVSHNQTQAILLQCVYDVDREFPALCMWCGAKKPLQYKQCPTCGKSHHQTRL